MKFLSEKDCTGLPGRFRDRMEKLGVDSNVGVSKPDISYNSARQKQARHHSEPFLLSKHSTSIDGVDESFKGKGRRINSIKHNHRVTKRNTWQPLTLSALSEYTSSIPAPGSGEFKKGAASMWKPKSLMSL